VTACGARNAAFGIRLPFKKALHYSACRIPRTAWFFMLCCSLSFAAPPSDPAAKKIYDHNYNWLKQFPTNFIVTNIRGENDKQYPERRQAAFDLLKERRDLTTVPDLLDELNRGSFLSAQICDFLGDLHAKKALPTLIQIAEDKKRPAQVRQKAKKAIEAIKKPVVEAPRPTY
jgi:hypothetical protein